MTKFQKAIAFGGALATVFAANPAGVFAQTNINLIPTSGIGAQASKFNLGGIIGTVITIILSLAAVVAFIFLLMGGLQWVLSGGDKEGTEKARKRITASLVGLAIIFSAFAIIYVVQNVFGISITNVAVPTIPPGTINGV